jgi:hypothetical protein
MHAEILIGNSIIMMEEENPQGHCKNPKQRAPVRSRANKGNAQINKPVKQ